MFRLPIIFLISILAISHSFASMAAKDPFSDFRILAKKTSGAVSIDGKLDEADWNFADGVGDFTQNFPDDKEKAKYQTQVKLMYDDQYLYVGAICYSDSEDYVITSLKRDFNFDQNDAFVIFLDPFDDRTNGFSFAVNPFNVQKEALIFNGSRQASDWDNIWFSKVTRHADHWVVEMAIPFKTLRYGEDADHWRINFARNDRKNFERSSWVPVPVNFNVSSLAFTGYLDWEEKLRKPGSNIAIIPYLTGGVSKNQLAGTKESFTRGAGFDAKVAVTPSMNLDLTFNPDFSQVEVDRQQTNLNRFELFFPERRQFFLENNDLFGDFGFRSIRPFFSRRIGIASDSLGRTRENRILGGARLSGKLNQDWRLGLLNMQTESDSDIGVPAQNFTVATFQRRVFGRSNIAGIFVNRQSFNNENPETESPFRPDLASFNRVAGLDFNLQSNDNKWTGKVFYHRSFQPGDNKGAYTTAAFIDYNAKNLHVMWNHERVGEGYNAEVGFVPRENYWRFEPRIDYRIFPKSGAVFRHSLTAEIDYYTDSNFLKTDENNRLRYSMQFRNTSFISFTGFREYIMLTNSFDPTRSGGQRLQAGDDFTFYRYGVTYNSDSRENFFFNVSAYNGGFYNGNRLLLSTSFNYRYQPYGSISLDFQYNKLDFPKPYSSAELFLVGPRFELSFTDQLFWSTFVQYNSQIDNINLNTRLQWRFRPVSDLYVVYTDNYFPDNLKVKNRALILKLSYWLHV
jgi:hypothetical protein